MITARSQIPLQALDCARHADLAYVSDYGMIREQVAEWGYPHCVIIESKQAKCYVACNDEEIVVCCEGTSVIGDWFTNFKKTLARTLAGHAHKGFLESASSLMDAGLEEALQQWGEGRRAVFTGHSKGAAEAAILAKANSTGLNIDAVHVFGCPRFCDEDYRDDFNDRIPLTYRWVNNNDFVPRLPSFLNPFNRGYRHVGHLMHISERGDVWNRPSLLRVFWDRYGGLLNGIFKWGSDGVSASVW